MPIIPNPIRDQVMSAFREKILERYGAAPLIHQRRWWCATQGMRLEEGVEDPAGVSVTLPDGRVTKWKTSPREGGIARVVADLGAFKSGKSWGAGMWVSGLAAVPGGVASLVGLEYSTVSPEFNYIVEFLLSSRGMGLKYKSLQNRPRDGKMWLELENGCIFNASSWERKESLKGKENDVYLYCEAYQLPGLEAFTSIKQNLVARDGFAIFPTTPDRPWVGVFHEYGHGEKSDWECVCGIPRSQNKHTYSAREEADDKSLMTSEKFQIAHYGQLGDFVGRVFNYQRGQRTFNATTHPFLFNGGSGEKHLVLPQGWEVVNGADTGTYYSALTVAFSPEGEAFVLAEYPNYRYVAGSADRNEDITIPEWARRVTYRILDLGGRPWFWADNNSQFKRELRAYGVNLLAATLPVETRTEITREYFQHGKIWLAPWLEVLPWELENASWPEEASASGKFARVKDRDHTLDCLEHILAKRPRGKRAGLPPGSSTWASNYAKQFPKKDKVDRFAV